MEKIIILLIAICILLAVFMVVLFKRLATKQDEYNTLLQDVTRKEERISSLQTLSEHNENESRELRSQKDSLSEDKSRLMEQCSNYQKNMLESVEQKRDLQKRYDELNEKYISASKELEVARENSKKFETQYKQFEEHIQNLTDKILEEKSKNFTETNAKEMSSIVAPLKEQINEFKKQIEEDSRRQTGLHESLKEQIKNITEKTQSISQDAIKLTNALKGDSKIMGDWGENILETILRNSGLEEGTHYQAQQTIVNDDEEKQRPDFIVNLPSDNGGEKTIVIDSKVSLKAYVNYYNADNDEDKKHFLAEHLKSIKTHIDELANKNYGHTVKGSMDFVMMFVPVEPAYLLAVQSDPTVWEYAYNKKVVMISATNMISCLRLIVELWKTDTRNKEAQAMAKSCGEIYNQITLFLETFEGLESKIKGVSDQFDKAKKQLCQGKGNVIRRLEKLEKQGIITKANRAIPLSFKTNDEDENEEQDKEEVNNL